jgi:hypothetical protein
MQQVTGLVRLQKALEKINLDQATLDQQLEQRKIPKTFYNHWTGIFTDRRKILTSSIKLELERIINIE